MRSLLIGTSLLIVACSQSARSSHQPAPLGRHVATTGSATPPQDIEGAPAAASAQGRISSHPEPAQAPRVDSWPTDCDQAAAQVIQWLNEEQRAELRSLKRDDLILTHFSLGLAVRNRQGLWGGNNSLIRSCLGGDGHPDDASMVVVTRAWQTLQKTP